LGRALVLNVATRLLNTLLRPQGKTTPLQTPDQRVDPSKRPSYRMRAPIELKIGGVTRIAIPHLLSLGECRRLSRRRVELGNERFRPRLRPPVRRRRPYQAQTPTREVCGSHRSPSSSIFASKLPLFESQMQFPPHSISPLFFQLCVF